MMQSRLFPLILFFSTSLYLFKPIVTKTDFIANKRNKLFQSGGFEKYKIVGKTNGNISDDSFFESNDYESSNYIFALSRRVSDCPPRVRKPWHQLSKEEKELYLDAVEEANRKNYTNYFVQLHMETKSASQAHETCGFLIWHRKFTLAYENMLRSLGKQYRCITLPYWDLFRDYAKMVNKECSSFQECSEFLRDMGGAGEVKKDITINGEFFSGKCCINRPCNTYCESKSTCSHCIPRGDWTKTPFPSSASYASLVSELLDASNYEGVNRNIQHGVHNAIHSMLGSAFSTFTSPADPIFFPYHAAIDLIHHIYYKCGAERDTNSIDRKKSHHAFMKCKYVFLTKAPRSTSNIKMKLKDESGKRVRVDEHPILRKFFYGIGRKYYELVDTSLLEENSYSYYMDDFVKKLLDLGLKCKHPIIVTSNRNLEDSALNSQALTMDSKSFEDSDDEEMHDDSENAYYQWYRYLHKKLMKKTGDFVTTANQIEYIECLQYDRMIGVPKSFPKLFQEKFRMHNVHPRCKDILDKIDNGTIRILIKWENSYRNFFG